MRDDFKKSEVTKLAQQSGYRCSNPSCRRPTIGPDGDRGTASIGVAAHIAAASVGGPRFDPTMTLEERSSIDNGIWLCQTCSRLIDTDVASYSNETLFEWKRLSEIQAYLGLRNLEVVRSRNFEDHEQLLEKLKVCENYGAVVNITHNNVDRFEFSEDFAEYLEQPS